LASRPKTLQFICHHTLGKQTYCQGLTTGRRMGRGYSRNAVCTGFRGCCNVWRSWRQCVQSSEVRPHLMLSSGLCLLQVDTRLVRPIGCCARALREYQVLWTFGIVGRLWSAGSSASWLCNTDYGHQDRPSR
jgi:hypothetical protein